MPAGIRDMRLGVGKEQPAVVNPSDEALVRRLRAGDSAAGEALVRRHYEPLMRYLQRLCGSDHLAEEMHQQTWLSVLDHIGRFDASSGVGAGAFKAWLFRIATNKANDLWRSRAREKAAHDGIRRVVETEAPAAGLGMERDEQQAQLRLAIEQLPENQKQVLLLRYYSGMKFIEIAELLGCPLNTALGRMHKAILNLKESMQK
jgi:RNA polymerase sigma-70 factor (ECF subfamily)